MRIDPGGFHHLKIRPVHRQALEEAFIHRPLWDKHVLTAKSIPLNALVLARVLHVVGVVLWIGGVLFVTTVLLPAVRQMKDPKERVDFFESVEGRFAWQARATTLLTGLTGFYMVHAMNAWQQFFLPSRWYLGAMVAVWALFTLMLFVLEPLVLDRWFHERAKVDPEGTFQIIQRLHIVLSILSLVTAAGAVAGAHGWFLPV